MRFFHFFGTTLEHKARILVFNIASGLLSLAIVSFVYHFSLKYDYDMLFMEYSQSLVELEEVRRTLNDLQNFAHKSNQEILQAKHSIITQLNNYKALQNRLLNESESTHFLLDIYQFFAKDNFVVQKKWGYKVIWKF